MKILSELTNYQVFTFPQNVELWLFDYRPHELLTNSMEWKGHGLSLGPTTGKLGSELVDGPTDLLDIDFLI